ncbi:MAG TPA: YopX family protein [Sphingobacteriaceae bacterium]|nr:YopX family protein [Sphingobacteriaceae bacterium]
MKLPQFRAWIKPLNKMVSVSTLSLAPATDAGIEYIEDGQKCFAPMKDCEVQYSVDIQDHSGNEYYFCDVIMTKTTIGVLVCCDGNLGLASWVNGAYHCFCSISKAELEASEIMGNIYEENSLLIEETA